MLNIVNSTIKLENKTVVFAAKYQLKRVTVAILNCASFQILLPYEQKR